MNGTFNLAFSMFNYGNTAHDKLYFYYIFVIALRIRKNHSN